MDDSEKIICSRLADNVSLLSRVAFYAICGWEICFKGSFFHINLCSTTNDTFTKITSFLLFSHTIPVSYVQLPIHFHLFISNSIRIWTDSFISTSNLGLCFCHFLLSILFFSDFKNKTMDIWRHGIKMYLLAKVKFTVGN